MDNQCEFMFREVISNPRKSVSSDLQTLNSGLKKQGAVQIFTNFEENVWKLDEIHDVFSAVSFAYR